MKRSPAFSNITNLYNPDNTEHVLEFQTTPPENIQVVQYPANSSEFWADPSVHLCTSILQVRQYTHSGTSSVYLRRLNVNGRNPKFHFPSALIETFIEKIDNILERVKPDSSGLFQLEGINKIETNFDFENFWGHSEVFRIGNLWVRPFLTKYGIKVRFWQEIREAHFKEVVNDNGLLSVWRGPGSSISLTCFRELKEVLVFLLGDRAPIPQ